MAELAAVVLAAGAGTRFGEEPKLLAELEGRPLVAHVVDAARSAASVGRVVVVAGEHAEAIRLALAAPAVPAGAARAARPVAPVAVIDCPSWAEGQSASLRCGLDAAGEAERVVVLVGDQPGVTPAAIDRIAGEPSGSRAAYDGRPGHPALLGPELIEAARSLTGDRGLRDVARWRLVECGHLAHGADVDTPQDLAALRSRAGGR